MVKGQRTTHDFSLEALRNGDRAEFARLVDAYYEMIYRLAHRMLENGQDAEDVLQETFIKAYSHLKDFDGRSSVSTWLYRIATNEALMLIRRRKPESLSIEEPVQDEGYDQEPMQIVDFCCLPEESFMSDEVKAQLDAAIEKLPPALRVVFILRDIQGLSTRETGQILELSEMAVKTRLSRARLRLREELSAYFGEQMIDIEGKRTA
jgi:RNA polymerase sigma-70 factor (ECF subfamily)